MTASARAHAGAEAVLRDGSHVVVRPIAPTDEQRLLAFLHGLSLDSRYLRFFSLSTDLARMAHSSVPTADGGRYGVVAIPAEQTDIVGHAGYWPIVRGRAEMAIAVADHFRGAGLGSILLTALAQHAMLKGIDIFEMEALPENHAVMRLFIKSGFPLKARTLDRVVMCELLIGCDMATKGLDPDFCRSN